MPATVHRLFDCRGQGFINQITEIVPEVAKTKTIETKKKTRSFYQLTGNWQENHGNMVWGRGKDFEVSRKSCLTRIWCIYVLTHQRRKKKSETSLIFVSLLARRVGGASWLFVPIPEKKAANVTHWECRVPQKILLLFKKSCICFFITAYL